jgi:type I restriction enzyme S subunit
MSELSEGWEVAGLPDVCELNPGKPDASRIKADTQVTFVPMAAVDANLGQITKPTVRPYAEVSKGFTAFQENDVIMAKITPCMENGKAAIARGLSNGIGFGSTEFHVFRHNKGILPEYLFYFIRQDAFRKSAEANMTGSVGQKRVPIDFLKEVNLPLPPLNEQRRIVAKLEKLLSRVDTAQARLVIVPCILKRFRQSVLAAACSGRLTADWREENRKIEPASELLEQIKAARLERATSNKETIQIQAAFSDGFNNSDERIEIPPGWAFCSIGAVGTVSNGSTPSRKVPEFWGGIIHWVSSGEVRNNIISTTRECITERGFNNSSVKLLQPGTVLLAMIGEGKTRGQTAILEIEATINQNIAAIDLSHGYLIPAYLWRWFQYQYEITRERGSGSGPQALNCQRVRELPLFLPPLTEQQEIIRRVESLFKTADALEARYRTAKAHVDKLTQSILARAFRGELVTTEAELARREGRDYEHASVLLERIRQECEQQQKSAKSNTRRRPKSKKDSATKEMFA